MGGAHRFHRDSAAAWPAAGARPANGRLCGHGDDHGPVGGALSPRCPWPRCGGARQCADRDGSGADDRRADVRPARPRLRHAQTGRDERRLGNHSGAAGAGRAPTPADGAGDRAARRPLRDLVLRRRGRDARAHVLSGPSRRARRHDGQHGAALWLRNGASGDRLHSEVLSPDGGGIFSGRLPMDLCYHCGVARRRACSSIRRPATSSRAASSGRKRSTQPAARPAIAKARRTPCGRG